jgi:hypothetical protein
MCANYLVRQLIADVSDVVASKKAPLPSPVIVDHSASQAMAVPCSSSPSLSGLELLDSMGFPPHVAAAALRKAHYNTEKAVELALLFAESNNNRTLITPPFPYQIPEPARGGGGLNQIPSQNLQTSNAYACQTVHAHISQSAQKVLHSPSLIPMTQNSAQPVCVRIDQPSTSAPSPPPSFLHSENSAHTEDHPLRKLRKSATTKHKETNSSSVSLTVNEEIFRETLQRAFQRVHARQREIQTASSEERPPPPPLLRPHSSHHLVHTLSINQPSSEEMNSQRKTSLPPSCDVDAPIEFINASSFRRAEEQQHPNRNNNLVSAPSTVNADCNAQNTAPANEIAQAMECSSSNVNENCRFHGIDDSIRLKENDKSNDDSDDGSGHTSDSESDGGDDGSVASDSAMIFTRITDVLAKLRENGLSRCQGNNENRSMNGGAAARQVAEMS